MTLMYERVLSDEMTCVKCTPDVLVLLFQFVEGKLSVRILDQARQQQDELEEEFGLCVSNKKKHRALLSGSSEADAAAISDDEDQDSTNEDDFYEHLEINEEDEKVLESFMPQEMTERKTLADAIMEKIRDKETELASHLSEISIVRGHSIDERVVHVYKGYKVFVHWRLFHLVGLIFYLI